MYTHREYRWQSTALLAMQEAAEAHLVRIFEDAYVPSQHIFILGRSYHDLNATL